MAAKIQRQLTFWHDAHIKSERDLLKIALALGARDVSGWSDAEEQIVEGLTTIAPSIVRQVREQIVEGEDPLGEAFCVLRTPAERRPAGATYTPIEIVRAMCAWAEESGKPVRIIDPGIGSGRFILEAGRRFRFVTLLGVEIDPLAAVIARGNIAAAGMAKRARIELTDFRTLMIDALDGQTLFIGNPPYVRHHRIEPIWKQWLTEKAAECGFHASQLAGLHVHFLLATVMKARRGDYGSFITAAEWLDVNYGSLVRELFLGPLGGENIIVVDPKAMPFPDAQTTAAVTYFRIGGRATAVRLKRVEKLRDISPDGGGRVVRRERLEAEKRWSHLTRGARPEPDGFVELGEICRVHRGQVTGANKVWIEGPHSEFLPDSVLFPSVTKARELINAGLELKDSSCLRRVIDLPTDLDVFDALERRAIDRFLRCARGLGADTAYVARNRKAWWSVGLYEPAPILATYMARRPPAFVRNLVAARHINIAHGLYPREPMPKCAIVALTSYLAGATRIDEGRTYAGGLTKFEPREMERILVPSLNFLKQEFA